MKKNRVLPAAGVFFSFALLIMAVILRQNHALFFYDMGSHIYSAHYMTFDAANISALIFAVFKHIFSKYLNSYLFSVYLFLLPAVFLLAYSISNLLSSSENWLSWLKNKKNEQKFLIVMFTLCFTLTLLTHFLILHNFTLSNDEYSYIFQTNILSTGKLYAPSPPMPDSFKSNNIVNDQGKWYSKYTIGWSLMLLPAKLINAPYLINALLASLTLLLIYYITKELFDEKGAFLGVFLTILSPVFILMAGTFFPHTAAAFLSLVLIFYFLKIDEKSPLYYSAGGAFSIMMMLLIRPADGGVMFLSLIPLLIFRIYKSSDKKVMLKHFLIYFLGFVVGIAALLAVNKIQTGDPFVFAFNRYSQQESWGFGRIRHTPLKGLWNFTYSFMRMSFWTTPFMVFFSLFTFFKLRNKALFLWIPIAGIVTFYFFYYSLGIVEFGSRYHFHAYIILIILAAGGISIMNEGLKSKNLFTSNAFNYSLIFLCALYIIIGVLPQMLPDIHSAYSKNSRLHQWMTNPPEVPERSLIFLREVPDRVADAFIRNPLDYKNSHHLLVLFLAPKVNRKLIEKFPDRVPFIMYFDYQENRFRIAPYPQISSQKDPLETPQYYIFAAINYKNALFNEEMTEKMFLKAAELDPNNHSIKYNLGYFYFETHQYEKGIEILTRLTQNNPQIPQAFYYLGRCLGETGRIDEAVEALLETVKIEPQGQYGEKAKEWIIHYNKRLQQR